MRVEVFNRKENNQWLLHPAARPGSDDRSDGSEDFRAKP